MFRQIIDIEYSSEDEIDPTDLSPIYSSNNNIPIITIPIDDAENAEGNAENNEAVEDALMPLEDSLIASSSTTPELQNNESTAEEILKILRTTVEKLITVIKNNINNEDSREHNDEIILEGLEQVDYLSSQLSKIII